MLQLSKFQITYAKLPCRIYTRAIISYTKLPNGRLQLTYCVAMLIFRMGVLNFWETIAGLDPGGWGGVVRGAGAPPPPSPLSLTQKINLKTELNCCVNSSGHKEPQNCDFSTTSCLLMPDSVVMSKVLTRCSNLVVECGTEDFFLCLRAHFVHPHFKSWIHPCISAISVGKTPYLE